MICSPLGGGKQGHFMSWVPLFERSEEHGRLVVRLGDPLVDLYLEFVGLRPVRTACSPTVAYDLKVFERQACRLKLRK